MAKSQPSDLNLPYADKQGRNLDMADHPHNGKLGKPKSKVGYK